MLTMISGLKDLAYRGLVKGEAKELANRIGNKERIISYLGGEKPEDITIPNRKSSYQMLYESLIEQLDDEDAIKLSNKKDLFILKKKVSILWEDFEDREEAKEKEKILERKTELIKKIEKTKRIEKKIKEVQEKSLEEINLIDEKLGIQNKKENTSNVYDIKKENKKANKEENEVKKDAEDILFGDGNENQNETIDLIGNNFD